MGRVPGPGSAHLDGTSRVARARACSIVASQEHLETWLTQCRDSDYDAGPVPAYVEREFRRYLECGILAHGFARARCG